MSTLYSIGQMNQLGDALEAAGFTPDDVTKLRSSPHLGEIRLVVAGAAKIVVVKHIIDCDADPHLPEGWEVEEHIKGGSFEWDPAKFALYLSEQQKDGKYIEGNKLRKELKGKPVFNACLLDYLLAHPELIPKECKDKTVFFWGTVYRNAAGYLAVRDLHRDGKRWYWDYRWLDNHWYGSNPAALRASPPATPE